MGFAVNTLRLVASHVTNKTPMNFSQLHRTQCRIVANVLDGMVEPSKRKILEMKNKLEEVG